MNILFITSSNIGRSILAEAIMNRVSEGRFVAFSAGTTPGTAVEPLVLQLLAQRGYEVDGLTPTGLDRFLNLQALRIDLAIVLCDTAHGELCRIPPGITVVAHWDVPDPAIQPAGDDRRRAYEQAFRTLERHCIDMMGMPVATETDPVRLAAYVDMIGWGNHAYAADAYILAGGAPSASYPERRS